MKIKRYTARDMRQAMQKVREDQGPDAVILSSRRSDGMVEIVAAIDYDEALVREAVEPLRGERNDARVATAPVEAAPVNAPAKVAPPEAPKPAARVQPPVAASVAALTKTQAQSPKVAPIADALPPAPAPHAEAAPDTSPRVSAAEARAALEASAERLRMRDEIGGLRQLLESQLSSLAWNDLDRRHPLRARVLRDLTRFGIEGDVADAIVSDLPDNISTEQSRYLPLGLISRRLRVDPAASDLAGVVAHVTVLEFDSKLRADEVLQRKLRSLANVDVILSAQTTEVLGDGSKVTGLKYTDRTNGESKQLELSGVFVQIGLLPNTDFLKGALTLSPRGEIEIDGHGRTSMPGVFAAGDATTTPFKQIVIAAGEGAKAALSAFDHLIRSPIAAQERKAA